MSAPAELADRIEREAPGRELDAAIAVAIKLDCRPNLPDDLEYLSLPNKHDPGPGVTAGHYWFHCRSGMSLRTALPYTTNIDAAMTLVPEGYCISAMGEVPDDLCWYVVLWREGNEKPEFEVRAYTLPCAICFAALHAQAQEAWNAT
jgi:hypothetical protein